MYVVSKMPQSRQSIAGSLFQTVIRLCTAVSYGIATAIFDAIQRSPPRTGYYANDPVAPYAGTFWFGAGVSVIGLLLVPFLRIGTQGHERDEGRINKEEAVEEASRSRHSDPEDISKS